MFPDPFFKHQRGTYPFAVFFRLRLQLLIAGDLQLCLRSSRRPQVPAAGVVGKAAPNGARAYVEKAWKIGKECATSKDTKPTVGV